MQLEAAEKRVIDIKQTLIEVKLLRSIETETQKANEEKAKLQENEDQELEQFRDEKYQENLRMLKYQAKKPNLFDWATLQGVFRFKSRAETEDYVKDRLRADGYMT